jgi:hypothetical protein
MRSPINLKNRTGSGKPFTMYVESASATSKQMYLPSSTIQLLQRSDGLFFTLLKALNACLRVRVHDLVTPLQVRHQ